LVLSCTLSGGAGDDDLIVAVERLATRPDANMGHTRRHLMVAKEETHQEGQTEHQDIEEDGHH